MTRRQGQKLLAWAAGTVLLGGFFAFMIANGRLAGAQAAMGDLLYRSIRPDALQDIVLVLIDDRTLADSGASEIGTLRLPKAEYAEVVNAAKDAGAAAIGIDVILSEPSSQEDVDALAREIERFDDIVLAAVPAGDGRTGLYPLPELASRATVASVLFTPDRDNVVRRVRMGFDDPRAPRAFSIEVVNAYLGIQGEENLLIDGGYVVSTESVRVGRRRIDPITIPSDASRDFLIRFFGPPGSFTAVSFADAREGRFVDAAGNAVDLEGKIVLIGESGTALHDEQYVPVSSGRAMAGVEIHANALQTILTGRFLEAQAPASLILLVIPLIAFSLAVFLAASVPISTGVLLFGIAGVTVVSWVAFEYGTLLDVVYPTLALVSSFVLAYVFRYFTERRRANRTAEAFGRFVSPHVVKEIVENPGSLKLGGDKRELTVLFSDIAGFTSIAEATDPETLVRELNEYLDRMSEVVLAHDGTIDKYIGDAVMAFWNAPLPQEDHATRACLAALGSMEALEGLNLERAARGQAPFKARIGINTGQMVVGNMGSSRRFDYTVIGDAVNLGARLEGANKAYGTRILVSESTLAHARDAFDVREVDLIAVKGKKEPVRVFELQAQKGENPETRVQGNALFALALAAYRRKEWDKAADGFRQVLEIVPEDGPAMAYLERITELRNADLPEDWDGVYAMTSK